MQISHGEIFQLITVKDELLTFSESACKVGILNQSFLMGIAGDADLGYTLLEALYFDRGNIQTTIELVQKLHLSAQSLLPSLSENGIKTVILFCSNNLEINLIPQDIIKSCLQDETLFSVATQMLCMGYSAQLRAATGNQAVTVGGAFCNHRFS